MRWWLSLYQKSLSPFEVMMYIVRFFLNTDGKSILVLAHEDEQPIKGKVTVYVSPKGNAHKIEVNVARGSGYEPILYK